MKHFFLLLLPTLLLFSCQTSTPDVVEPSYKLVIGKTMGTTYSVKFEGENPQKINQELDSLFFAINQSVSTYIDSSLISQFNSFDGNEFELKEQSKSHLIANLLASQQIHKISEGRFDPTVMPLVNFWGFGYEEKKKRKDVSEEEILTLLNKIGLEKINYTDSKISKSNPDIELDFSAIAKGYAVDKAAELLEQYKIQNYLVEIGGEVFCKGKSATGKDWKVGINTPKEDARINDYQQIISLSNKGMATSGNYRNYYEVDGKKYGHTINPKTGYPQISNLLSATIIASNCMEADGYATACMVGNLEQALSLVNSQNDLEGYFIYADDKGEMQVKYSEGLKDLLK